MTPPTGVKELVAALAEAMTLVANFAAYHDEPCRFDHNGACQAHLLEESCTVALARELLARMERD